MHHTVRSCWRISKKEFSRTLFQLCLQEVHIVSDVSRHTLLCLFYIAAHLFPAGVQDRDTMKGPRCLGGMNPLKLFVAFWVAEGSEQLMFLIVGITKISKLFVRTNEKLVNTILTP